MFGVTSLYPSDAPSGVVEIFPEAPRQLKGFVRGDDAGVSCFESFSIFRNDGVGGFNDAGGGAVVVGKKTPLGRIFRFKAPDVGDARVSEAVNRRRLRP